MGDVKEISLSTELINILTPEQAWHYQVVPKEVSENSIELYFNESKPLNGEADELEMIFGKSIKLVGLTSEVFQKTIASNYRVERSTEKKVEKYDDNSDDFLANLIFEAKKVGSSDIHIESYEESCRVRLRIDGKLVERFVLEKTKYPQFINKIKIKANLDIAEKRLPQDGRIFFKEMGEKFDIRVSVLPTLFGEKVVMRLLNNDATDISIESLGFEENQLANYLEGVKKPHGIVLISGPTGSGKTTTLYATLKVLNKATTNVVTVEDPIEYTLEGINQVQLKEGIGLTFASALKSFLRQDPDVIMLGEIRDGETAEMAVRAALTGHLVLSTIHTNSAWGTISRLIDMGVPSFLIASTLNVSVAQRLVRKLCAKCKTAKPIEQSDYPLSYKAKEVLPQQFVPVGCNDCYYTGYKGRLAVYEVVPINIELTEQIKNNNNNVNQMLADKGVETISQKAFELLKKGVTSMEEVYPLLMGGN